MVSQQDKGDISPQNLQLHGIYYDDNLQRTLPKHVDAVKKILLSFDKILPGGDWSETLQTERLAYESGMKSNDHPAISGTMIEPNPEYWIPVKPHEKDANLRSETWKKAYSHLEYCESIAQRAQGLKNDSEDGWTNFWRRDTFLLETDSFLDQPGFQ